MKFLNPLKEMLSGDFWVKGVLLRGGLLWQGGLPPLDCAAVPDIRHTFVADFTTASQPNGAVRRSDKPPRHNGSSCLWGVISAEMLGLDASIGKLYEGLGMTMHQCCAILAAVLNCE